MFRPKPQGIYNSEGGCLIFTADTTHRQALGKKQNKVGASGRVELPFTHISRTFRCIAYDALYSCGMKSHCQESIKITLIGNI
ncbi:MAG: hypothetical protein II260_02820 [Muribaculaceae bacterium]|nr:hypothetical protein [Muribaculaceae bacterium]